MSEPPLSEPSAHEGPDPGASQVADPGLAGRAEAAGLEVAPPRLPLWQRLAGLALVLVALVAVGHLSGLDALLADQERLQASVANAGAWGVLLLIGAFTLGLFIQVPGIVFALTAIYCYGPLWGGILAHSGAVVACSAVFVSVRAIGGQALAEIERPWVKAVLAQVDAHPLRTVTILRLIFWSSPQLNYALALTKVRFREHLLGTAVGLIPIKIVVAIGGQGALDYARSLFGG